MRNRSVTIINDFATSLMRRHLSTKRLVLQERRTLVDSSAWEVLVDIIISLLLLESVLNFSVIWHLCLSNNRLSFLQTSLTIDTLFVTDLEIAHKEIAIRVELHKIK